MKTEITVMGVLIGLLILGYMALSSVTCSARWKGSELKTDWGPIQGCRVQLPDGRWMPEDRVREIDTK